MAAKNVHALTPPFLKSWIRFCVQFSVGFFVASLINRQLLCSLNSPLLSHALLFLDHEKEVHMRSNVALLDIAPCIFERGADA